MNSITKYSGRKFYKLNYTVSIIQFDCGLELGDKLKKKGTKTTQK